MVVKVVDTRKKMMMVLQPTCCSCSPVSNSSELTQQDDRGKKVTKRSCVSSTTGYDRRVMMQSPVGISVLQLLSTWTMRGKQSSAGNMLNRISCWSHKILLSFFRSCGVTVLLNFFNWYNGMYFNSLLGFSSWFNSNKWLKNKGKRVLYNGHENCSIQLGTKTG